MPDQPSAARAATNLPPDDPTGEAEAQPRGSGTRNQAIVKALTINNDRLDRIERRLEAIEHSLPVKHHAEPEPSSGEARLEAVRGRLEWGRWFRSNFDATVKYVKDQFENPATRTMIAGGLPTFAIIVDHFWPQLSWLLHTMWGG